MDDYSPGLGKVYGKEFVCRAKEHRFKTPMHAHRYLFQNEIRDLAPYSCTVGGKQHYHLTGDYAKVRKYRVWMMAHREQIIHRIKQDGKVRARNRRRKNLRFVAHQHNFGVIHDDIMDEIELGIHV